MTTEFDEQISSIAALAEPIRRTLYRFVIAQPAPVTREEAATGVGAALHTVKFHLDRLVDDGLLEVDYRRPPGRGGPGAGRPSKRYRRAERELSISVPERRYELASRLLAQAVSDAEHDAVPVRAALAGVAHSFGSSLGTGSRSPDDPDHDVRGSSTPQDVLLHVLRENGYEPRAEPSGVALANCPFHALAEAHTELVCTMNLDLLRGLVEGLGGNSFDAVLDPAPRRCCVRLVPRSESGSAESESR